MTPLPQTPADCQAPFKSEAAKELHRLFLSLGGGLRKDKIMRLAQQVEFEYLWLRELWEAERGCDQLFNDEWGRMIGMHQQIDRRANAFAHLLPYLTPNTPDHE